MVYRTLQTVLYPDSHLSLPSAELPLRPVRVMVTILEPDDATTVTVEEPPSGTIPRIRSPRLVHPEQAADFVKEVIEVTSDARV